MQVMELLSYRTREIKPELRTIISALSNTFFQMNELEDTLKYSLKALACALLIPRLPFTISDTTPLEPIIPTK